MPTQKEIEWRTFNREFHTLLCRKAELIRNIGNTSHYVDTSSQSAELDKIQEKLFGMVSEHQQKWGDQGGRLEASYIQGDSMTSQNTSNFIKLAEELGRLSSTEYYAVVPYPMVTHEDLKLLKDFILDADSQCVLIKLKGV